MHWLFLLLFIDSGSGAFGEHALWQSEPDQVVRAGCAFDSPIHFA